jgi:hypothetical protein
MKQNVGLLKEMVTSIQRDWTTQSKAHPQRAYIDNPLNVNLSIDNENYDWKVGTVSVGYLWEGEGKLRGRCMVDRLQIPIWNRTK